MGDVEEMLEFVDELPRGGRRDIAKYERILAPLMERKGEWAKIMRGGKGVESRIGYLQSGKARTPDGEWEFALRTMPDGEIIGFARYLGEKGDDNG